MKLFCFAYAGGSAMFYNRWQELIHGNIEIIPVEMPGRGTRFNEKLCNNMEELVEDLYYSIEERLTDEYMFYGHSMGSWIVYFLLERIRKAGVRMPERIFLSGKEAPHIKKYYTVYHKLSTSDFIKSVYSLGGISKELFKNVEAMQIYIPILKNDYQVVETCQFINNEESFDFDITIFNGTQDSLTEEEVFSWSLYTNKNFEVYSFDGGHFFIYDYVREIVDIIVKQFQMASTV